MTSFLSATWALIKTVPKIYAFFEQLHELYLGEKIRQIEDVQVSIDQEYYAVYNAIKNAKTKEERRALSITLNRLNNGHKL